MQYKIIAFNEKPMIHVIEDVLTKNTYRVDLFVDSSFNHPKLTQADTLDVIDFIKLSYELVGQTIEIKELLPCEYVALDVTLI